MTDRELLKKAAEAADLDAVFDMYGWDEIGDGAFLDANEPPTVWNPLADDGDALRLAVKLGLAVVPYVADVAALHNASGRSWAELRGKDTYAATRRAIVRAAAALAIK